MPAGADLLVEAMKVVRRASQFDDGFELAQALALIDIATSLRALVESGATVASVVAARDRK